MKQLDEQKKITKQIEGKLAKDDIEHKLAVKERFVLEEKLASMKKKNPNTIDYRVFMLQKLKTGIQANVLDDAFLTKIHKYDVQEMENSTVLSSSNYKYLLG
jgi:hypothetical protein